MDDQSFEASDDEMLELEDDSSLVFRIGEKQVRVYRRAHEGNQDEQFQFLGTTNKEHASVVSELLTASTGRQDADDAVATFMVFFEGGGLAFLSEFETLSVFRVEPGSKPDDKLVALGKTNRAGASAFGAQFTGRVGRVPEFARKMFGLSPIEAEEQKNSPVAHPSR